MRNKMVAVLLIILTVSFFGPALIETACADQLSEVARNWEDIIIQGRPSQLEQEQVPTQEDIAIDILREKSKTEYTMLQEKHRIWLLIAIVVSTPTLLVIILFCLKNAPDCSGESLVNAIGLVLVVEGTMFIAVAAATTEQLTAPIGILGAIAGYLFGSAKRKAAEES